MAGGRRDLLIVNLSPPLPPKLLAVLSGLITVSSSSILDGVRGREGYSCGGIKGKGEGVADGDSLPVSSSSELEDELELLTSAVTAASTCIVKLSHFTVTYLPTSIEMKTPLHS